MRRDPSKREFSRNKIKRLSDALLTINTMGFHVSVLDSFIDILRHDFELETITVLSRVKNRLTTYAHHSDKKQPVFPLHQFEGYTEYTFLPQDQVGPLQQYDALLPIWSEGHLQTIFLLSDAKDEVNRLSILIKEADYIKTWGLILANAYKNARQLRLKAKELKHQNELDLARQIQHSLLPKQLSGFEHLEAEVHYRSLGKVGGDYYNILEVTPGRYFICIADASGKGISASLMITYMQSALNALILEANSLDRVIKRLNHLLFEKSEGDQFVTGFFGLYESQKGTLQYHNCGHPPVLLCKENECIPLEGTAPGLGMVNDIRSSEIRQVECTTGHQMLLYTDGVSDYFEFMKKNPQRSLEKIMSSTSTVSEAVGTVVQTINNVGKEPTGNEDDTTILGIRLK